MKSCMAFSLSNLTRGRKYIVCIHNPCVILDSSAGIKLDSNKRGHALLAGTAHVH